MYTMIISDGTTLEFIGVNGNNLISEVEIDDALLSNENLATGVFIHEDGAEEPFADLRLRGKMRWETGEWYYAFGEMTEKERMDDEITTLKANLATATANITVLQSSLTQVAEAVNGMGGKVDIPVIGGDIT